MSRREDTLTRELGYFAIGILPNDEVRCRNCATFVSSNNDRCPGCGEHVCRVCGCSESAACVLLIETDKDLVHRCTWSDRDKRLCSGCAR